MEVFVGAVFLTIILMLFNQRVQAYLKTWLYEYPSHIFMVSWVLAMLICFVAGQKGGAMRWDLRNLIGSAFAYTFIPTFLIYNRGRWNFNNKTSHANSWIEFVVILMLWLPIEFAMTINLDCWLRGYLFNSTRILVYGVAVILGLSFFLLFKQMDGMKYNLPRSRQDFVIPLIGLLAAVVILIPIGLGLGFIRSPRIPLDSNLFNISLRFGTIFFVIAIPEEILFRSLIQNWLIGRFGPSNKVLFSAALIFGVSHLNNGPGALPNWRYMIVASIAGFIFGKVFQKSNSIFSSAGLHAAVNTIKHTFFA